MAADPAQEPAPEPRGVFNPRVVDLVRLDAERDEVVLVMLEERAWGEDPQQLRQLEEKFNAYLGYVQGGHVFRDYPDYAGKDVCFQLDCAERASGEPERMLRAMQNFAAGEGIRFVVRLIEPQPPRRNP